MRIDGLEKSDAPPHYVERINRAIDYIVLNIESPLKLEAIAQEAWLSPFHFHRIFKSIIGETVNQFIKRIRLERSLQILSHDPKKNLTQVAVACGFGSLSDFSRSFKDRFGVAPRDFDLATFRAQRRQEFENAFPVEYQHRIQRVPPKENPDGFEVRIRKIPPRTVAYIRVLEPYQPGRVNGATDRLMAWAEARGLEDGQWLGYMWEDPEIVAMKDCRYDVGLVVPDVKPEGEIGRFEFPEMTVAELELRGPIELEIRALDYIYGAWLPTSGYVPADLPAFESWIGKPFAHGLEHFELHAQIPVVIG